MKRMLTVSLQNNIQFHSTFFFFFFLNVLFVQSTNIRGKSNNLQSIEYVHVSFCIFVCTMNCYWYLRINYPIFGRIVLSCYCYKQCFYLQHTNLTDGPLNQQMWV